MPQSLGAHIWLSSTVSSRAVPGNLPGFAAL